jgi:hypothetical protein
MVVMKVNICRASPSSGACHKPDQSQLGKEELLPGLVLHKGQNSFESFQKYT